MPLTPLLSDLFRAIDAKDARGFLDFLTPDATFRYANAPAVTGRDGIEGAVEGFFVSIRALSHRVLATWADTDSLVCQGEVTYTRHDGSVLTLPFANVLRLREGLIREYQVYIDLTPLFDPRG